MKQLRVLRDPFSVFFKKNSGVFERYTVLEPQQDHGHALMRDMQLMSVLFISACISWLKIVELMHCRVESAAQI
jgi:hypothetical protein